MCEILKKDQVIQFIKQSFVSIYNQDITLSKIWNTHLKNQPKFWQRNKPFQRIQPDKRIKTLTLSKIWNTQLKNHPNFDLKKKQNKNWSEEINLFARGDNNRSTFKSQSLSYAKSNTLCRSCYNHHFPFKSFPNFLHFYMIFVIRERE